MRFLKMRKTKSISKKEIAAYWQGWTDARNGNSPEERFLGKGVEITSR